MGSPEQDAREGQASIPYGVEALQQHLADTKLRLALLTYQQQRDAAWQAAQDALPADAPQKAEQARFFAQTEARTLRLLRRQERRHAGKRSPARAARLLPAAAALVLALALGLGTALAVSPALRMQALRLLIQVTPQYTQIRFAREQDARAQVPSDWVGRCFPAWLPEGYTLLDSASSPDHSKAVYTAEGERFLRFIEYRTSASIQINTEGYSTKDVDINGAPGMLSWKEGHTSVVWSAYDRAYLLSVTEDTATALRIAESVGLVD